MPRQRDLNVPRGRLKLVRPSDMGKHMVMCVIEMVFESTDAVLRHEPLCQREEHDDGGANNQFGANRQSSKRHVPSTA